MKLIQKIGIFRIMLIPLGIVIIITAFFNNIIGMGIIGAVVLIFGLLNRCLLMGKCDVEPEKNEDTIKK